jgi:hypothetical protein
MALSQAPPAGAQRAFDRDKHHLTLRSGPQGRVSKGGDEHIACCPPFETLAALAPQGEVVVFVPPERALG